MGNLMYSILVFGVALQLVSYLLWSFNVFAGMIQYPFGTAADMNNMQNMFKLDVWMALISGTGVVIGVAALLLRQGTYALYALLIFAIGVFYRVIVPFLIVIPNTVAALLPASTNPLGPNTINPIQVALGLIVGFAIFIFMFELVVQRKIS
jgi:hypothetical protein